MRTTTLASQLIAISFLTPVLSAPAAHAANLIVTTLTDEQNANDKCSLREAIINANNNNQSGSTDCPAGSGAEVDVITSSVSGTISLTQGTLPAIADTVGITIDGGENVTISGNNTVRIGSVGLGGKLNVQNLVLANASSISGGGIRNAGILNVVNCTFSGNRSDFGAALDNVGGTINVSNSTFDGNQAFALYSGGIGGAIYNSGNLTVNGSTFSRNTAEGEGGAIFTGGSFTSTPAATVTNSTFAQNAAVSVGGGIRAQAGNLNVINSTFSRNSAPSGGGISRVAGTTTLRNTLLANSTGQNCDGTIVDGGGNLDDAATCNFTQTSSQSNGSPGLAPAGLQDNGGPTNTIALVPGASDAIDKGVNSICASLSSNVDQRGIARPADGNNDSVETCDIGAFEFTLGPAPAGSAPDTCNGQSATTGCTVNGVANQSCLGTPDDDVIVGTGGADIIIGLSGNDTLSGGAGSDLICGGSGNDSLVGGKGRDQLSGEDGDDTVKGGRGGDTLNGGAGSDTCLGGAGGDSAADCESMSSVP